MNRYLIKVSKFGLLYAMAVGVYYAFDFVYMPWLAIAFGYKLFIPLYPSILLANFGGVYAYDYFKEDVLFIQLGKNWLGSDTGKLVYLRRFLFSRRWLTFIVLSVWPSPIASYLFFRKSTSESVWLKIKVLAIGSLFCTMFWGGGLAIIISLVSFCTKLLKQV